MQQFWYKNLLTRDASLLNTGVTAISTGEELEETGKTQYVPFPS